jgi:hypothetical protein
MGFARAVLTEDRLLEPQALTEDLAKTRQERGR